MILALMQPYFFPYLAYFELISRADQFIFFDTSQYMKGGWVNRNRVLKSPTDWHYLTVPIKRQSLSTRICETQISDSKDWRTLLKHRLSYYEGRAPFYGQLSSVFNRCLEYDGTSICELNIHCIKEICAYIGIECEYGLFSEIDKDLAPIHKPSDWALNLAIAVNASEYINLPGGREIYSEHEFEEKGIRLTFADYPELEYDCAGYPCIPSLSILDVLMWLPASRVVNYLKRPFED